MSLVLIAVVCAVIGSVTTLVLREHLKQQMDRGLGEAAARVAGIQPPGGGGRVPPGNANANARESASDTTSIDNFVTPQPLQPEGTVGAKVVNGVVTVGKVGVRVNSAPSAKKLDAAQLSKLGSVPRDRGQHTVDLPSLGEYRAMYIGGGPKGNFYVAVPMKDLNETVNTLILVEASVTAAGLVAAGLAGMVIVGLATRPLSRVATTATRVSELPLHSGEVILRERVPESETDPHTEIGQVGAALNRLLDHVHGALHARQQSETRVRQFVADASHELRTPLASIKGYAELTRRGREEIGPDTRHALGRIESEAGRMALLVEDLLLLARLDAGRPLQFEETDLVPLVVDSVSDSHAAGRDHNWRLDLPDEPALVSADAARIQQVLVNLLGNARKHTPPGTTVTARVQRRGDWMCVDVEDNGPGIPAELLPHVFERFARGDSARSRATGSTGLGLAIVQAVTAAHGGAVTVDSVPGRTVFTVYLPPLSPFGVAATHSQVQHSPTTQPRQGT